MSSTTYYKCPFCGSNCIIKASRQPGSLLKHVYYECKNSIECGWRARFNLEYITTLHDSHLGTIENGNVVIHEKSKNPDLDVLKKPT